MSNRYFNPSLLPFEAHAPIPFTQELSSGDVVESNPSGGAGLYPHVVVNPAPEHESARRHDCADDHDVGVATGTDTDIDVVDDEHRRLADDHVRRDHAAFERRQLRRRDADDRAVQRSATHAGHVERRAQRKARRLPRGGRRAATGTEFVASRRQRPDQSDADVRRSVERLEHDDRDRRAPELSVGNHGHDGGDGNRVAAQPNKLKRAVDGPLQGTALGVYVILLPYVVATRWGLARSQSDPTLIRALLVALATLWLVFLARVGRDVWRLHAGRTTGNGASAWLAGLLVAVMPFLGSSTLSLHHAASFGRAPTSLISRPDERRPRSPSAPVAISLGGLPLALIAKRRSDLLRQQQYVNVDDDVDETVTLLRSLNPELIDRLRRQIGARGDGVMDINWRYRMGRAHMTTP